MSGLVGLIHASDKKHADIAAQLKNMDATITHRGDLSETYDVGSVGGFILRHRKHGAFTTDIYSSNQSTVILDGNITNKTELAREEQLSNTISSSALISHLFSKYLHHAFQKLDGSYAIVIYFKESGRLIVTRDEFAGRPIFFSLQNHTFFVASEIKAILANNAFKRSINKKLIPQSLTYGLTSGPETLFKNIYKVMPGYIFDGDIQTGMKISFMLTPTPYKKIDKPIENYADDIWDLLGKNINRQTASARSTGMFLSSGIDSSLVAAKQAEKRFESSLAISCGYTDIGAEEQDESAVARRTAAAFNLQFKTITVSSSDDILNTIRNIIYKMDEPTRFAISIPIEKSLETLKGNFDCLLTGMFADVLYGTEEHYDSPFYKINKKLPITVRWIIKKVLKLCQSLGIPKVGGWANMYDRVNVPSMKHYAAQQEQHIRNLRGLVATDNLPTWAPEIERIYEKFNFKHPEDEWTRVSTALYVYCWNELFEILASYAQCDTIHPFLSKETYNLSLAMPYKYKIAKAHTKPCLRELVARKISPELAYTKKKMFQSPGSLWLMKSEQLKQYVLRLQEPDAKIKTIMDPQSINTCIEQYKNQLTLGSLDESLSRVLYSLIGYEIWLEIFFDKEAQEKTV